MESVYTLNITVDISHILLSSFTLKFSVDTRNDFNDTEFRMSNCYIEEPKLVLTVVIAMVVEGMPLRHSTSTSTIDS